MSLAWLTGSWLAVARVPVPPMLPRFGGLLVMRVYLDRHAALCMGSGGLAGAGPFAPGTGGSGCVFCCLRAPTTA